MKKYLVKIDGQMETEHFDSSDAAMKHIIAKFEEDHSLKHGDVYLLEQECIMSINSKYKEN